MTATSILLGRTTPLTGAASAYASVARGADAYFKYANARGGVNGRTITYKYVDDAYNPAQTVQATRMLVEQDDVFADLQRARHGAQPRDSRLPQRGKVPQLFVASGATTFGRDGAKYPWTMGFQPSYQAEGWVYGKFLTRTKPKAKVAILAQNDDYGRDLLVGLKRGIARSGVKIVAAQNYEVTAADVQSQIAKLKASGADTLALFATPKFAIQSLRLREQAGVEAAGDQQRRLVGLEHDDARQSEGDTNKAVEGSVSINFLKDPGDPRWAKDPAIKLYRVGARRSTRRARTRRTCTTCTAWRWRSRRSTRSSAPARTSPAPV